MKLRDKWGYPIEIYKGRHIHNFFRYLFLTNLKQTFKKSGKTVVDDNGNSFTTMQPIELVNKEGGVYSNEN